MLVYVGPSFRLAVFIVGMQEAHRFMTIDHHRGSFNQSYTNHISNFDCLSSFVR